MKDDPNAQPPRKPFAPGNKPRGYPDDFKWTGKASQAWRYNQEVQRVREAEVKKRLAETPISPWVMGDGTQIYGGEIHYKDLPPPKWR